MTLPNQYDFSKSTLLTQDSASLQYELYTRARTRGENARYDLAKNRYFDAHHIPNMTWACAFNKARSGEQKVFPSIFPISR